VGVTDAFYGYLKKSPNEKDRRIADLALRKDGIFSAQYNIAQLIKSQVRFLQGMETL